MLKKFLMMAIVAVTASVASPSASRAGFSLTMTYGANSFTVNDRTSGNVAFDQTLSVGNLTDGNASIRNIGVVAVSDVTLVSPGFNGITTTSAFYLDANLNYAPTSAGALFRIVNLSAVATETSSSRVSSTVASIQYLGSGPAQVTILTQDNTFNAPAGNGIKALHVGLTILENKDGVSVTSTAFATPDDSTVSVSSASTVPTGFSATTLYDRTGAPAPFTLKNTATVNFSGAASVQFQSDSEVLNATPVPSALILAAFGIPAFGLLRRRFATKVEATTAV